MKLKLTKSIDFNVKVECESSVHVFINKIPAGSIFEFEEVKNNKFLNLKDSKKQPNWGDISLDQPVVMGSVEENGTRIIAIRPDVTREIYKELEKNLRKDL